MSNDSIRFDDGDAYERFMGRWSRLAGDVFLDWLNLPLLTTLSDSAQRRPRPDRQAAPLDFKSLDGIDCVNVVVYHVALMPNVFNIAAVTSCSLPQRAMSAFSPRMSLGVSGLRYPFAPVP